jgi:hypothetical protein
MSSLGGTPTTKELAWRRSPSTVTVSTEVAIADGSEVDDVSSEDRCGVGF